MIISKLAKMTKLSPNCSPRTAKIDTITPHHMAGNPKLENQLDTFADLDRGGSANYLIASDGTIACCVPEDYRAWTSSNPDNDNRAITIEVANDGGAPEWHVSDAALRSLILLSIDVCKRYSIKGLSLGKNLTWHSMFAATTCPGPYLKSKFPYVISEVNTKLQEDEPMTTAERKKFNELESKVGALEALLIDQKTKLNAINDQAGAKWGYIDGNLPSWAKPTIRKLYGKGILKGDSSGNLQLSYVMLRMLVILDRAGVFD